MPLINASLARGFVVILEDHPIKMNDVRTLVPRTDILIFTLDEQRYALPLATVERVVRAVEMMPWPEAGGPMLGMVNVQGHVIPVVNLRQRLNLPEREITLSDRFIIVQTAKQRVILVVDEINDVFTQATARSLATEPNMPEVAYDGMVKFEDGITPILNLDQLFA